MTIDAQFISQLVFAFIVALMGALIGGLVRWGGTRRDRRLKLTLDLYEEFHHPLFYHVRALAHETLERHGTLPVAYQAAEGEAREALASMVHFWEKAAQLLRIGALEEPLMRRFFAQYARWWDELLCHKREALNDEEWGATLRDIDWLFARLKRGERQGRRR
jgi:hypothetical protein